MVKRISTKKRRHRLGCLVKGRIVWWKPVSCQCQDITVACRGVQGKDSVVYATSRNYIAIILNLSAVIVLLWRWAPNAATCE